MYKYSLIHVIYKYCSHTIYIIYKYCFRHTQKYCFPIHIYIIVYAGYMCFRVCIYSLFEK